MNRRHLIGWSFFVIGLGILFWTFFRPIVALHFLGDDAWNSYLFGYLRYNHLSAWDEIQSQNQWWLANVGRLFPVMIGTFVLIWSHPQSASVMHALQIVAIGLNAITLVFALQALGVPIRAGMLAAALVPICAQLRSFYDPITGFLLEMPYGLELLLLSIVAFGVALRRRSVLAGALAALLWIASGFVYEIAFPIGIVFVAMIAWCRPSATSLGAALRSFAPIAAGGALVAMLIAFFRAHSGVEGSAYAIRAGSSRYGATFADQAGGALPLNYVHFDPYGQFASVRLWAGWSPGAALVVLVSVALVLTLAAAIVRAGGARRRVPAVGLLLGCSLWLLPALVIAASPRWQTELKPGLAYLPVYDEYFGVATIVALVTATLLAALPSRAGYAVAIVAALAAGTITEETYRANLVAIKVYAGAWTAGRYAIEDSLRDGLLASVPDGSTLLVDGSYFYLGAERNSPYTTGSQWHAQYLFYGYAGKRITIASQSDALTSALCARPPSGPMCAARPNTYVLNIAYADADHSTAQAAHLAALLLVPGAAPVALADEDSVIERGAAQPLPALPGRRLSERRVAPDVRAFDVIADAQPLPLGNMLAPGAAQAIFGSGFNPAESDGARVWHWMGAHGSISLVNAGGTAQRVRVRGRVSMFGSGRATVTIGWNAALKTLPVDATGTVFSVDGMIAPHAVSVLNLATTAPRVPVSVDPRDLRLQVSDVDVRTMPATP
uniref:Uncharacterized protein n=1 Tax=uncultured organism TaxID=155900 RepID=A0A7L9QC80_9ZZZZ|nr:hypothetical protein [uncultured organism]